MKPTLRHNDLRNASRISELAAIKGLRQRLKRTYDEAMKAIESDDAETRGKGATTLSATVRAMHAIVQIDSAASELSSALGHMLKENYAPETKRGTR